MKSQAIKYNAKKGHSQKQCMYAAKIQQTEISKLTAPRARRFVPVKHLCVTPASDDIAQAVI